MLGRNISLVFSFSIDRIGFQERSGVLISLCLTAEQRLQATGDQLGGLNDDFENKRVERLPGQKEWGELPVSRK